MLDGRWLLPDGLGAEHPTATEPNAATVHVHDTHGHGPPIFFKSTERNFNAGPNFIFNEFIKWSSVSNGSPDPSMHWSRKFCNKNT